MNSVQFFMVKFQYVSVTYRKKIIEEKLKSSEESYLSHFQVWFCTSRLRLVCVFFFCFVCFSSLFRKISQRTKRGGCKR